MSIAQFPTNTTTPEYQAKQHRTAKILRNTAEFHLKHHRHVQAADCMYQATLCAMRALGAYRGADV